ncbi:hypothetical protein [Acinetobacter sp. IK40]|uniref:hypothetical protein n=1 Tax=Acinetobacter sp. IK40 TaxID=2928897 RepID=UPI002D1F8774|nr:hypothetical protein [Acinetobacter sp. IK40]MEB3792778.1 hypothetical protein [Acinetobacter sp. IK40]
MDFQEKISNDDFFKLMKHRIFSCYSKRTTSTLREGIIFKETIDALKLLENFAFEIKDSVWEKDSLVLKCVYPEIKKQFNDLRLKAYLFPHPEMFNHLFFQSVYGAYRLFDQILESEIRKDNSLNSSAQMQKKIELVYLKRAFVVDKPRGVDTTTFGIMLEQNKFLEDLLWVISQIQNRIDRGIHRQLAQEENVFNNFNQQTRVFDDLLRKHKSVYVLVLDIYFESFFKSLSEPTSVSGELKIHQIEQIRMILAQLAPLHGIIKIETHFKEGLNLHCVLMFEPTKGFSEKNTIEMLRRYLQQVIGNLNHIDIRNWNTVIKKNYSKTAVGLIGASQPKNVAAFKYWILSFFYTLDLHIEPYLPRQLKNHLAINANLDFYINAVVAQSENQSRKHDITVENALKDLEKANKALQKIVQPFFSEKDEKNVWNTKSLSNVSKGYIEAVMHYYREIESDEQKLQSMMHIEIFIETLITAQFKAFDLNDSLDQDQLTVQLLRRAITRLGQRFLLLGKIQVENEYFIKTIHYSKLYESEAFQISKQIFTQIVNGHNPKEIVVYTQSYVSALRNTFTQDYVCYDRKTIKEMRTDAYWKYKKRINAANVLFKELMKQDCLIYRMTVELIPEVGHIPQAELAVLWTAFLHQAQRAEPLSWKTGYFGLWSKNNEGHFYADVFFVLDHRAFADKNSIPRLLNKKWCNFVKDKAQSKLNWDENPKFKICKVEGKPMMQANKEYFLEHLLIESTNKERKIDFLKKVIPTFLSHSVFIENTMAAEEHRQAETDSKLLIKSSIAATKKKRATSNKKLEKISSSS